MPNRTLAKWKYCSRHLIEQYFRAETCNGICVKQSSSSSMVDRPIICRQEGNQYSYVYVLGDRKDKSCKFGITKTSRNIYKEFVICHLVGEGEIYLHRFPDP